VGGKVSRSVASEMSSTSRQERELRVRSRVAAALALLVVSTSLFGAGLAERPGLDKGELRRALPGSSQGHGRRVAVLTSDNRVFLEAQPLKGEGLLAFSRRLCGTTDGANAIREGNGGSRQLVAGRWYRLPLEVLGEESRRAVLGALFPDDRGEAAGWRHTVGVYEGLPDETLWRIAERFTGAGQNYPALRSSNGLQDNTVLPGQSLLIPAALLSSPFRAELAAHGTVSAGASAGVTSTAAVSAVPAVEIPPADPRLTYDRDADGEFALYRLRPGEALYSSVVVRYTGRIYASDVNALAADIARRSGIEDVTDIPIGYPVRIPFDVLQPQFLPPGHPLRLEYEADRRASAQFSNPVRSQDLAGITIILDAGHGGRDSGTTKQGVWESIYVYDIMVRLKRHLETATAAEVFATTRDGEAYHLIDRDTLPFSHHHMVLTTPPYSLQEDSRPGVHLRWYLANSLFREARKRGRDPEKVVFISLHADSLHPSLRGAMAYIPDANLRTGSYAKEGSVYASRREVREKPRVSYSWKHRVQSEGLSRQLADQVIGSFRRRGLAVHPDQPVRQKIYRGRRPWVPAVLRYNEVPAELLLEVCNLANDQDRALLTSRAFRQEAAEAIADGIRRYYGSNGLNDSVQVARSAK
jgi:N-acetylmuramoyl-L-alanine amidase